jgi:hypothetical protein
MDVSVNGVFNAVRSLGRKVLFHRSGGGMTEAQQREFYLHPVLPGASRATRRNAWRARGTLRDWRKPPIQLKHRGIVEIAFTKIDEATCALVKATRTERRVQRLHASFGQPDAR